LAKAERIDTKNFVPVPCDEGNHVKHVKVNELTSDTLRLKSTGPYAKMTQRMSVLVLQLFETIASFDNSSEQLSEVFNKYRVIGRGNLGQIASKRIITGIGLVSYHIFVMLPYVPNDIYTVL
jgi:hypothetical protein